MDEFKAASFFLKSFKANQRARTILEYMSTLLCVDAKLSIFDFI